ncbi:MAG: hypothetical protein ACKO70_12685 [Actinomycetota bacterium]
MDAAVAQDLARLDRLPRWPWSRGLLVNLGGSFFLTFFDIVVIGAALPTIADQFGVTSQQSGLAITAGLIGLVIGSFLGAYLAARGTRVLALQTALRATLKGPGGPCPTRGHFPITGVRPDNGLTTFAV